jgi:hypothetical protein
VHEFTGTTYLLNEPDTVLDARVKVDLTAITVLADGTEVGNWKHDEVKASRVDKAVHLTANGETLVLNLEDPGFLLDLLGVDDPGPGTKKRKRSKPVFGSDNKRTPFILADLKTEILEEASSRIDRRLAISMGAAAALILLGAALSWGPFRILDPGSFPIGRLLAGFGGLGGLLALYLAYFDRSRVTGSAAAVAAGIVTFAVVYLYARSARLGIGFVLALLGSQALVAVGVLGMIRRPVGEQSDE